MITLIALALAILVVAFVAYPLFRGVPEEESVAASAEELELERVLSQRESTYAALKDLEFDLAMGKLSEEDYQELSRRYKGRAIDILKELDQLAAAVPQPQPEVESALSDRIEQEVLALRQRRRQEVQAVTSGGEKELACARCGKAHQPGDLFCAGCGYPLAETCPQCGVECRPSDRFCSSCGAELTAT